MSWVLPDDVRIRLQLGGDYKSVILADLPLAYWRFEEASGLSFSDATGNGHTLTVGASTGYTYGVASGQPDLSKGLATAGTQARLVVGGSSIVVGTTCSFEFWIKPGSTGTFYSGIIGTSPGGAGVYYEPASRKINCFTTADHFNTTALTVGALYHVAIVIVAGVGTFYINGVADGTFTAWPGRSIDSLFVLGGGQLVASLVDEVAVYDYALTAAQVALHASAGVWTDVSGDLTSDDILLDYGIKSSRPEDRCAVAGQLAFGLRNGTNNSAATVGYYSPYNGAKRTGFNFGIRTQLAITYSGSTIYWLGRLRYIVPQSNPYDVPVTWCAALDWMDEAARQNAQVTLQRNQRSDQAFTVLVAAVPFQPNKTSVDVGSDTYLYAFDNIWTQAKVMSALADLARSEAGYIGQKRDTISGQTVFFESRHYRPTVNTLRVTLTKTMSSLDIVGSSSDILNHVRVTVHPRRADSGATTVVAKFDASSSSTILPGQSQIFELNFTDPVQRDTFIGATNVVSPLVATTDYTMNTLSDGTGIDLTASFSVTATVFASSIKIVVANTGTLAGYVTKLQARGDGVYALNPVVGEFQNTSSIRDSGDNIADIDLTYQSDPTFAYNFAQYVARLYGTPLANVRGVSFCGNQSATLMTAAVFGEISEKVALVDTVNGLQATQQFYINAVSLKISQRNRIDCTWQLAPADNVRYWLLGTAGASELGSTAVLGL